MCAISHWLCALRDTKKKAAFLRAKGFYRNPAGGWCDSHCMGTVSERDYRLWTLDELKENYPHYVDTWLM